MDLRAVFGCDCVHVKHSFFWSTIVHFPFDLFISSTRARVIGLSKSIVGSVTYLL
jgi:hypothetical protein